ncbi:MAG: hypothetical protein GQ527_07445 [Bacteroidales bacterium]|nr:hypothetical protein [Bacteroidales bacterium]
MKKGIIIIFGLLFVASLAINAQPMTGQEELGDRYHAQKIAFITDALDLTPDEATSFWPLYNEYDHKKKDLLSQLRAENRKVRDNYSVITESEAAAALVILQNHMINMNSLTIEYQNKYTEVLSSKKVLLLLKAEKDFRRSLLKRLGEKRKGRR